MVRLEKEHWKNVRSLCQKVLNLRLTVVGEFKCTEAFSQASLSSQRTRSSPGSNIFPQETCFFESQGFESHMKSRQLSGTIPEGTIHIVPYVKGIPYCIT